MSARHKAPRARTSGLVVKTLAEEVLVYDLTRHKAHSLNRSLGGHPKPASHGHLKTGQ